MAYEKYNLTNDAQSNLDAPITASATSIALITGSGSKFPPSNFILKFVQYTTPADPTTPVVKFEYVLVTNRSGDTLTVTRGFEGSTPASFLAGDFVYLTNHKAITKDIQDEVTRLESDKLNKGGLRTALANTWRMFFSNGSNAETELAFGASGRVLTSNGASSVPSWEVPTINIPALTEDATGNMENDFFPKNNGVGVNTKIKMTRYRATDVEFAVGTATNKFVTPSNISTIFSPRLPGYKTTLIGAVGFSAQSIGTDWTNVISTYTVTKSILSYIDIETQNIGNSTGKIRGVRIKQNGVIIAEVSVSGVITGKALVTNKGYSFPFLFDKDDTINIEMYAYNAGFTDYANTKVSYSILPLNV